jgi:glycosyltransferase involved in cell wall biosynthesis
MRLLYISYWNIGDPLTAATVYPNLKTLQEFDSVRKIIFVNTEREAINPLFEPDFAVSKIDYQPILSKNFGGMMLNKILDFIFFPKWLAKIAEKEGVNFTIARGAPAGSLAYLLHLKTGIPFLVESFEPHADYMAESKVWSRFDLRYLFQKYWEKQQKKVALGLLPVSENYKKRLISEGVPPSRIDVVPCTVDRSLFAFDADVRTKMREEFNIAKDAIVGLYAGKYGGLYLEEKSFKLYQEFFIQLDNFFLFILSPIEYHDWIRLQINLFSLPVDRIHVCSARHRKVPDFCSASDFGFATYKPGRSKAYLSPVKVGEYWSCGLPIVLTRGVGDESDFVESRGGGVLFDPEKMDPGSVKEIIKALIPQIQNIGMKEGIIRMVHSIRSQEKVRSAYSAFLGQSDLTNPLKE